MARDGPMFLGRALVLLCLAVVIMYWTDGFGSIYSKDLIRHLISVCSILNHSSGSDRVEVGFVLP